MGFRRLSYEMTIKIESLKLANNGGEFRNLIIEGTSEQVLIVLAQLLRLEQERK